MLVMTDKKNKKLSLIALFSGYFLLTLFILLVVYGRTPETVEVLAQEKEEVIDENETIVADEIAKPLLHYPVEERRIFEPVIRDRINRGVILDADDDDVVVVRDIDDHTLFLDNDRLVVDSIDDEIRLGAREGYIGGGGITDGLHLGDTRVHNNNRGDLEVERRDLLAQRLDRERDLFHDIDESVKSEDLNQFGLDTEDSNLQGFREAESDKEVLNEELDLNFNDGNGDGFDLIKGDLYAYNFPSQGVGAGIGNAGVGAAAGFAGIGAGIGEAVLNGETVPTLGGIGTSPLNPNNLKPTPENDPDNDGLPSEVESGLGTNPLKSDTDGDGITDGKEVEGYSNPMDSSSTPTSPGLNPLPQLGGVGGMVNGAGAGPAAGLVTGRVKEMLGLGVGCALHGEGCDGHHGHGHGGHGEGHYDFDHLPANGALHIMMHVDRSGSLLATREILDDMLEGPLKAALLPYYNNDENLYKRRVTIVDDQGERTLNFFKHAAKKDNVLALVFQDEAGPEYHEPIKNTAPQNNYIQDLSDLKKSLNGHKGIYRGIMVQVDRGRTFSKPFKDFVESAWRGEGYLSKNHLKQYYIDNNRPHVKNKSGIVFSDEYHAKSEGTPEYYMNLLFKAAKRAGLDLNNHGGGLKDGQAINRN